MMSPDDLKKDDVNEILGRLNSLENRIALLESYKASPAPDHIVNVNEAEDADSAFINVNFSLGAPFETKLGEYGLAWLGNIVLFFGIAFLWQYFNNAGKPFMAMIAGIISVASVFGMSHYFRKSYTHMSFIFSLSGFIILYYIVLRLHYFNSNPYITNQAIATILLLMVSGVQLFFAVKRQSQVMAGLALTLAMITAYVCNYEQAFFLISFVTACLVLYSFWKYNWWKAMISILCISFIINLVWLLKNPVSLVKTPDNLTYYHAFLYFSIIAVLYSMTAFRKPGKVYPENLILVIILLTGCAYSVLLFLLVIMHFPHSFVPFFIAISAYCIAFSVVLKFYSPWKYSPALFALFGFVGISIAVFGTYHFPDSYLLLTIQSFLVLTLALWYRSHIITLMNTFLLIILVLFYYQTSGTLALVNFSIPVVAFLSARIINWQKERLNIKTDLIRNIYLIILFFSLLFATYRELPGQYLTVSWLAIAGIYFVLSIVMKNFKYRWMAMGNLLVSAFHLFLADLAKIDLIFRIMAFLVFAIISILISTYYVKKLKKQDAITG